MMRPQASGIPLELPPLAYLFTTNPFAARAISRS
jgi:hypothetical protein